MTDSDRGGDYVDDPFAGIDLRPKETRDPNPWHQLLADLTSPAPMSHWGAEVTTIRIREYDRIRTFLTRAVLLLALATLIGVAPDTSWIAWALLVPATVQVALEIFIDLRLDRHESTRGRIFGKVAAIAESAHSRTLVNVTGVIGVLAVPANIVAAAYFTGPGQPSWAKVAALAAASAYGVSAIVSFLTDTTHYSAHQSPSKPYRVFRAVRPHFWLIISVLMTGIVAGSVLSDRWAAEMEPLAWLMCLFPAVIGMKLRDYERFLRASSQLLPRVQDSAKALLATDYHNANTDVRVFTRDLSKMETVPAELRVKAAALAPVISLMSEAIDHDKWIEQGSRPTLSGLATKSGADASLSLTVDIRLDELRSENYELARNLITALLVNVGQAMDATKDERRLRDAEGGVSITGEVRAGNVHLVVRDPLPLIDSWCARGSTTLWLHNELVARGGVGLSQHPVDPDNPAAGKEIRACWPVKKPPLRLREAR